MGGITYTTDKETGEITVEDNSTSRYDPSGVGGDGSRGGIGRGVVNGLSEIVGDSLRRMTAENLAEEYNRKLSQLNADPSNAGLQAELDILSARMDAVKGGPGPADAMISQLYDNMLGETQKEWMDYTDDLGYTKEEMLTIFGEVVSDLAEKGMPVTPESFFDELERHPEIEEFEKRLEQSGKQEGLPASKTGGGQSKKSDKKDDNDTAAVTPEPIPLTTGGWEVPPTTGTWTTGVGGTPTGTGTPTPGLSADPDYTGIQPIILDLDGDGVEVAFGEDIYFDLDDDGFLEQTSWAAADDGFLVIDKLANDVRDTDGSDGWGDGVIDQSNELVLSSLGLEGDTDLQALARYDLAANGGNGGEKLNANDAIWNRLKDMRHLILETNNA